MDSARLQVLTAIQQGQVTVEEGARLLRSLSEPKEGADFALRLRVENTRTGRARIDVVLPYEALEACAHLDLSLDGLWGSPGAIPARVILELVRSGARGLLVEAADEVNGQKARVVAEPI